MTTMTKTCEAENCHNDVRYGIESINVPKYCSFGCRDRSNRETPAEAEARRARFHGTGRGF